MTDQEHEVNEDAKTAQAYELGFLLSPLVAPEHVPEESLALRDVLEKDGVVISTGAPVQRALAYGIDKIVEGKKRVFTKAFFGFMIFETEPKHIQRIKAGLEENDSILRFLIIKRSKESLIAPKRPMMVRARAGAKDKKGALPSAISDKELDKTIEELVIE